MNVLQYPLRNEWGVDEYYSEVLLEDKADFIEERKPQEEK